VIGIPRQTDRAGPDPDDLPRRARLSVSLRRRLRRTAPVLGLAALALGWALLDAGRALVVSVDVGQPDAIVMLASHEWERLPATAAEARRYKGSIVLLTVPAVVTVVNCYRCADRRAWLVDEGVDNRRIVELPQPVRNTYDEAAAVADFATRLSLRRVMVVTSPYHTRRARSVFDEVVGSRGIAIGVRPALEASGARPGSWWIHAYDRHYVLYEWAANVAYWFRYGILPVGGP
jgi:uncharacterized SAM-binding protein YcdF (DUF218 family)